MIKIIPVCIFTILCSLALCSAVFSRDYSTLGAGIWSIKIKNPSDSGTAIAVRAYFNPNQPPWNGDMFYISKAGISNDIPSADKYLQPGDSTAWIDIGDYMSSKPLFYATTDDYLSAVFLGVIGEKTISTLKLQVELARGKEEKIVRTVDFKESRPVQLGYSTWLGAGPKLPTLGLMIPVSDKSKYGILTFEEAAQQQIKWLKGLGPTPKPIKYIWFISHQSPMNLKNPSRLDQMQAEIVNLLGEGNLTNYVTDRTDLDYLKSNGYSTIPAKIIHRSSEPDNEYKQLKEKGIDNLARVINFGDEIDIDLKSTPEQQDAAFVEYLQAKKFNPVDFILPENESTASSKSIDEQWKMVHLGGPLTPAKPKLLYEAAVFRYELWTRELAAETKAYQKLYGRDILTGANYSPHIPVWPDVRKWINVFKDGGMVMPWSEDWWWQVPEASPQSYGMILAALRHAADYHNAPACFYTIPDPGPEAKHLLRMNYFALGNQIKVIDHFAVYHQAYGTCDYIEFAESKDKFAAIHRITSAVAKIDKRLYDARMRKAQVAILLSKANDVWNNEDLLQKNISNLYNADLNVDNHERKAIWLALRHAQIPVDVITDDDVADGMLKGYKVLYLVGQEIQDRAIPNLISWVKNGGTLVASGGGGLYNQYREPNQTMRSLYSLGPDALDRRKRSLAPSEDLPSMNPIARADILPFSGLSLPVLCYKHSLSPDKSVTIAKYEDGTAAGLSNKVGKGKAVLLGFLPGLAYIQPAMVNRKGLAENYQKTIGEFISSWSKEAKVKKYAVTSDPLVEATLQESKSGAVVTLVSFKNQPAENLTVSLPGLPNAKKITSIAHGELQIKQTKQGPTVTLPIDQGDFLLVD